MRPKKPLLTASTNFTRSDCTGRAMEDPGSWHRARRPGVLWHGGANSPGTWYDHGSRDQPHDHISQQGLMADHP